MERTHRMHPSTHQTALEQIYPLIPLACVRRLTDGNSMLVYWTIDADKLHSHERYLTSPLFSLEALGLPVGLSWRLVLSISAAVPGIRWKQPFCLRPGNAGIISFKCEHLVPTRTTGLRIWFSVGTGLDHLSVWQPPRGPVCKDFRRHNVAELSPGLGSWELGPSINMGSRSFVIAMDIHYRPGKLINMPQIRPKQKEIVLTPWTPWTTVLWATFITTDFPLEPLGVSPWGPDGPGAQPQFPFCCELCCNDIQSRLAWQQHRAGRRHRVLGLARVLWSYLATHHGTSDLQVLGPLLEDPKIPWPEDLKIAVQKSPCLATPMFFNADGCPWVVGRPPSLREKWESQRSLLRQACPDAIGIGPRNLRMLGAPALLSRFRIPPRILRLMQTDPEEEASPWDVVPAKPSWASFPGTPEVSDDEFRCLFVAALHGSSALT